VAISQLKISEGRRLPVKQCCERPKASEIAEVCKKLGLPCQLQVGISPLNSASFFWLTFDFPSQEAKAYSRDWLHPGRVKVQLRKDDNTPLNSDIATSNYLTSKLFLDFINRHYDYI
jgi:signal recognition particle subunit SEC65